MQFYYRHVRRKPLAAQTEGAAGSPRHRRDLVGDASPATGGTRRRSCWHSWGCTWRRGHKEGPSEAIGTLRGTPSSKSLVFSLAGRLDLLRPKLAGAARLKPRLTPTCSYMPATGRPG